jgi:hypothetical protein
MFNLLSIGIKMKNKLFFLIGILALNTSCFAMMESDIEDDVNSTSASTPTAISTPAETTTKPKRNMHSKIKTDDSWMKKAKQEIELPQKDIRKVKRSSLLLDRYQNNLEFSQSNSSLSNIEKPEVGRLKKSRHSISIPKLERAHSGMLTIEDHIAREHLSADILAEDIFLLTHLLYNRLTLAMNDPKLENYVETLKNLKEIVINGYKKAFNYAEQTQTIPTYFQDYAQIHDETNNSSQSTTLIEFIKSLQIAETLKNEARDELESRFLKRFNDDAIDDDMMQRGLFLRTINEILSKCRLYMDKYPYAHAYGEIVSKNFYIKQFLIHFKNLTKERLSEKKKKTPALREKRSSFTVSTTRNAKLEKVTSQLNLTTEMPSALIAKKKESYLAPIKNFLKEVIQNTDQEIMSLQESEIILTTSSVSTENDTLDTSFLSYWTHPIHNFEPNNKLDAEELILQLSRIVEIYEKALNQTDPISYDPLHMFNLLYKEVNPYWAEYTFYIHFTENTPHIGDKKDAFNPFGFLPLNEYECRFLAEHHCGRGKLKVARDFLK